MSPSTRDVARRCTEAHLQIVFDRLLRIELGAQHLDFLHGTWKSRSRTRVSSTRRSPIHGPLELRLLLDCAKDLPAESCNVRPHRLSVCEHSER